MSKSLAPATELLGNCKPPLLRDNDRDSETFMGATKEPLLINCFRYIIILPLVAIDYRSKLLLLKVV